MNRMVVLKTHRGWEIGTQFDEIRISKAREYGAAAVMVTPVNTPSRKLSLAKRGFVFLGGVSMGNPIYAPSIPICAGFQILTAERKV